MWLWKFFNKRKFPDLWYILCTDQRHHHGVLYIPLLCIILPAVATHREYIGESGCILGNYFWSHDFWPIRCIKKYKLNHLMYWVKYLQKHRLCLSNWCHTWSHLHLNGLGTANGGVHILLKVKNFLYYLGLDRMIGWRRKDSVVTGRTWTSPSWYSLSMPFFPPICKAFRYLHTSCTSSSTV